MPCCMRDEGGPLGTGVQAQVPNHLKLRWSKAKSQGSERSGKGEKNSSGEGQGDERKRTTDDVSKR